MVHLDKLVARRVYIVVLLLLLLVDAAGFWYDIVRKVSVPYQLDYGEGIVLYQATKVHNLASAYKPIDQYPFIVFHYPPLYHFAVNLFSHLTGSLITAGRWVSACSGLLIEVTIGLLVFFSLRFKPLSSRLAAACFAGLLVNVLDVMRWTKLARVDMLALLLSFVGVAIFVLSGRQRRWQFAAFTFFVAALFTKQTMIAAPLACLSTAVLIDRRQAVRLAAFMGILGTAGLAALAWVTRGEVIRHLFLYNQNPFSFMRMVHGLSENFKTVLPIVALAFGTVFSAGAAVLNFSRETRWKRLRAWLQHSSYRRVVVVGTLLLIYSFFVSLTYGKEGSNYNYFLEWNLTCCPLAAILLFQGLRSWSANRLSFESAALVIQVCLPVLIALSALPDAALHLFPHLDRKEMMAEASQAENSATALKLIREANGPVLSEDMLLLIQADKEVPGEPAILEQLAEKGIWDERPFVKMIQEKKFSVIVVEDLSNRLRFTPTVAAMIDTAYLRTRSVGNLQIYEPRIN